MRINNNNNLQPSFGMKSVMPCCVTKEVENAVDRLRPEILKIGHVAAECIITQGQQPQTIKAMVAVGVSEAPPIVGIAEDVFCEDKLLSLIHMANGALNQAFIDLRLPQKPTKADFNFSTTMTLELRVGEILDCISYKHFGTKPAAKDPKNVIN